MLFLDARQQEHLVVHREAEGDAEHQDRRGRIDRTGGREMQAAGQMALLEDPHHGPEGGAQTQQVQHHRLHRHQHASGHEEQQGEGDQGDDERGQSEAAEQ